MNAFPHEPIEIWGYGMVIPQRADSVVALLVGDDQDYVRLVLAHVVPLITSFELAGRAQHQLACSFHRKIAGPE